MSNNLNHRMKNRKYLLIFAFSTQTLSCCPGLESKSDLIKPLCARNYSQSIIVLVCDGECARDTITSMFGFCGPRLRHSAICRCRLVLQALTACKKLKQFGWISDAWVRFAGLAAGGVLWTCIFTFPDNKGRFWLTSRNSFCRVELHLYS